jgi:predicted N-acetyltransferase YhbS
LSFVARTATPADLGRLVPHLDQQFVFGKGRRVSLAQRFPAVYCAENARNIFLLEENAEIASSLACKRFNLLHDGSQWRGAMIGAVYTREARRGEGLASRLLEYAAQSLRDSRIDFAVLWTDQPAFYARLGWTSADRGVLGEFEGDAGPAESRGKVTRTPAQTADPERIERVRRRWCDCLTPRQAGDYRQLPPPAEAVDLLEWGAETDRAAYALVGNCGDTSILYELIGHPGGFPLLWHETCRGRRRILANDVSGSPSHRWLAQNTGLVWQAKPLAMWLPLSAKTDMARIAHWHIPYFDRI